MAGALLADGFVADEVVAYAMTTREAVGAVRDSVATEGVSVGGAGATGGASGPAGVAHRTAVEVGCPTVVVGDAIHGRAARTRPGAGPVPHRRRGDPPLTARVRANRGRGGRVLMGLRAADRRSSTTGIG